VAVKEECPLCEDTHKVFKKPIPCGGGQNLDRCKYVSKLRKENRELWKTYCDLSGDLSLQTVSLFFDWRSVPNADRKEIWEKLKLIQNTFNEVARKRKAQESLAGYGKNAQKVWGRGN
jgi:hypothetical protein